jgi:uncharacterized protein involved in type VI secretion and phage assembly
MSGGMRGLVTGIVRDVDDPAGQGRVKLDIPTMPGRTLTAWAPIAAPMAGKDRGVCFFPELDDEAIVGFIGDDPEQPVVLGFTWNGVDTPPTKHPRERNIRSLDGHTIRMIDGAAAGGAGKGSVAVEDANGNKVTLSNGKIRIESVVLVEIFAPVVTIAGPGWSRIVSPISSPI